MHSNIESLLSRLTLEEKVNLLTGKDFWNLADIEKIGLRSILVSDGPSGVRGELWDEREPSLNLPSSTTLGSSWSRQLAAEYGHVLASEAKRKGVDVVLGPTINLHRSPLGGRHFECISEDPLLTGAIASEFIKALQSDGIGACPKHYVANDFETDRFNADVVVDERTLRELYLRPFEDAILEGQAWTIMSAYNSINGKTATENDLLGTPLKSEWGFDGVVISDWTAVRSLESAKAEQDLVMPGPNGPWGQALVDAVRSGDISEEIVDTKVRRILLLAERVGAVRTSQNFIDRKSLRSNLVPESLKPFAKRAAIEGSVLLKNNGILPITSEKPTIALIGHNASAARTQGGGSATVLPVSVSTPLSSLRHKFGNNVTYSIGAVVQRGVMELKRELTRNPVTGDPGVRVEFLDVDNEVIYVEDRLSTNLVWVGGLAPVARASRLVLKTTYTPNHDGRSRFGFGSIYHTVIKFDGVEVLNGRATSESGDPFRDLLDPPFLFGDVNFTTDEPVDIEVTVDLKSTQGHDIEAVMYQFGIGPGLSDERALIESAVIQARKSNYAIVVVGTNSQVESEGFDRTSLELPGLQNDLVNAVCDANENTIVIVNSGAPVTMPWRDKAAAVLLTYFGGQEMGEALVDMLVGNAEPGGRLTTTWPELERDVPVLNCTPDTDGKVTYSEGLNIGYRAWINSGKTPAFEFGYGLSYTTWEIELTSCSEALSESGAVAASIKVTNTGDRPGKQVVQVYASRNQSTVTRPPLWLVGFSEVICQAGESKLVEIEIPSKEFAYWDSGWVLEPGAFNLHFGTSSKNFFANGSVESK